MTLRPYLAECTPVIETTEVEIGRRKHDDLLIGPDTA
jgi:hypothetical protein